MTASTKRLTKLDDRVLKALETFFGFDSVGSHADKVNLLDCLEDWLVERMAARGFVVDADTSTPSIPLYEHAPEVTHVVATHELGGES